MRSEQIETSHLELQNSGQFTSEHPYKALAKSAPLLISRGVMIALLQYFAKRAILAQKSEAILAEYTVISVIEIFSPYSGLHIISTKASHLHQEEMKAEQDIEVIFCPAKIGELYQQGVLFGFMLMLPTAILCAGAPTIFRLTGQSAEVVKNSASYFQYSFFAYFADMLYRSQTRIAIGLSQSHSALIADTVQGIFDVIFTYCLLNGKLGFPEMGVEGAALAYLIAAIITAGGNAIYFHRRSDFKKYRLFQFDFKKAFLSPEFKDIVKRGLHIFFTSTLVYITQIITTFLCGLSGDGALVGLQAAGSYSFLVSLPMHGFSEAANVVLGKLFKRESVYFRTVGNVVFGISALFSLIAFAVLIYFLDPIARIFVDYKNVNDFRTVKTFLCIQGAMEVIASVSNVGADVLSACLETKIPFLLSTAFIFLLNSALVVGGYVLSGQNTSVMYAAQLTGIFLDSLGILLCWRKKNTLNATEKQSDSEIPQITRSPHLFLAAKKIQPEAPRHYEVAVALPS